MPLARRRFRGYLPLFPRAIESLDLSGHDLVISISHAVAKGVRKPPGALHLCYCLTPMRYAWDLRDAYLATVGGRVKRALVNHLLDRLREWDRASATAVDRFAGISRHIVERIGASYGREAEVVYPPVDVDYFAPGPAPAGTGRYYLTASRWVPYKRIDAIVGTFRALPGRRLVVTGDGPDAARIRAAAGPNVEFAGEVSRDRLRTLMRGARAFVFAAEEDFGIVPLEAQACGTPVIAYARGAAIETLRDPESRQLTSVFFEAQTPTAIAAAINEFEAMPAPIVPAACRANAERFATASFQSAFVAFVGGAWLEHTARRR
jgi:glycosyltransferase involved in cell wall biosynthesis